MPSSSLFGRQLRQLSTDCTLFYFMTAVVQVIFLFIYWIGIVAFARPQDCGPGVQSAPQQWAVTFVLLALFISQATVTVAAALCTLKGTPLEPSKRRWVSRLSYAYLASLPLNCGLLAWAAWVVEAGDGSCWSSGNKSMPATIVFGAIGVLVGQLVGWLLTMNQLADVEAGVFWHALTRTGTSSLVHAVASYKQRHRGPRAALEELATQLQRLMAGIDAEKTDVAAGLVCAKLLQEEAAEAAAGRSAARGSDNALHDGLGLPAAVHVETVVQGGARPGKGADGLRRDELLAWADKVCCGATAATPIAATVPASAADAQQALHYACFAAAAYGARQYFWRRGTTGVCAARSRLRRLAAEARAEDAGPLAGWAALAPVGDAASKPNAADWRDLAAARQLLGPGCPVVALSRGDRKRSLLPHLVALDLEAQAVVLAVAGDWEPRPPLPATQATPAEWLACARAAASQPGDAVVTISTGRGKLGEGSQGTVHSGCLAAADALLQALEGCQLLQKMLRPGRGNGSVVPGTDCSGWPLVLAGHGLGAGAAALLSLRLLDQQLGPSSVWAFGVPGELCSGPLAAALASCCCLTAVVVGDDAAPRASSAALRRLVNQAVVGLARLRYCKTGLLAGLLAEAVGPQRWRRRWLSHGRALRPLAEVPEEALAHLQRHREWQGGQGLDEELEPAGFPGRVLLLSRAAAGPATMHRDSSDASGAGSSSSSGRADGCDWQAGWVGSSELAGWGVRVTKHAAADHHVSRLLGVLGNLVAAEPGAPRVP